MVIGDSNIGKTAFINALTENHDEPVVKTCGVDFKQVTRGNFRVIVWDTPGEQRFRKAIKTLYHKATVLVLAFDSANTESFINLEQWIESINQHAEPKLKKVLLGFVNQGKER